MNYDSYEVSVYRLGHKIGKRQFKYKPPMFTWISGQFAILGDHVVIHKRFKDKGKGRYSL